MATRKVEENESIKFYREYGIAEWREKQFILSDEEVESVITELENSEKGESVDQSLLEILRLPYPRFVESYFSKYPAAEPYLHDPAFGYKMYFLNDSAAITLAELIRNPQNTICDIQQTCGRILKNTVITELLKTPLSDIPKIMSGTKTNKLFALKYVYISQYMNLAEAKKLGIPMASFFEQDGADGYMLEDKLNTLNPATRIVMAKSLGMYGGFRKNINQIVKENNISVRSATKVFNFVFPLFFRTYGEFKNALGYEAREYAVDEAKEYQNKTFRMLDLGLQANFIENNVLTEAERAIVSSLSNNRSLVYIAAKYIYRDPEVTAKNLIMIPEEVKTISEQK